MKYILNLTGVPATPEQVFDGVIELVNSELKERLVNALSFDKVPLFKEVEERAELIEDIFVEDTEIRTGLKLKEISKNSGKKIPLWSKLKEMDIGVMLNTDTFMVSILDEVLSNSAKVMYSVFKTEPIFANITKDGRDIIQPSIFRGDNIFIDARKSIIKINNVSKIRRIKQLAFLIKPRLSYKKIRILILKNSSTNYHKTLSISKKNILSNISKIQ